MGRGELSWGEDSRGELSCGEDGRGGGELSSLLKELLTRLVRLLFLFMELFLYIE